MVGCVYPPLNMDHILTWGGPHLRDALLKAPDPTGFSRLVSLSAVECMPDPSVRIGFRLPHDDLRSQKRDLYSLGFGRRRIACFGPDLRARFCESRSRAHHWSSRGTTPPVYRLYGTLRLRTTTRPCVGAPLEKVTRRCPRRPYRPQHAHRGAQAGRRGRVGNLRRESISSR